MAQHPHQAPPSVLPKFIGRDSLADFLNASASGSEAGMFFASSPEATLFSSPLDDRRREVLAKENRATLSADQIADLEEDRAKLADDLRDNKITQEQYKAALLHLLVSNGYPVDAATFNPLGQGSDQFGLISTRINPDPVDVDDGGSPQAQPPRDASPLPAEGSDPTLTNPDQILDEAETIARPPDVVLEHPWVYSGGTMTHVGTGEVVQIPEDRQGLFNDGGKYSAGDGAIFDSSNTEVASFEHERDADGRLFNVVILPPGADSAADVLTESGLGDDALDGLGGGSLLGSGGDGSGGPLFSGTVATADNGTGDDGAGTGTGSGDGDGDGSGEDPGMLPGISRAMTPHLFKLSEFGLDNIPTTVFKINRQFRRTL